MRLWRRNHRTDEHDPDQCDHSWRLRDVSIALPGPYVCEVCDHCGILRLHGPEALTGGYAVTTTLDSRLQQAANSATWRTIAAKIASAVGCDHAPESPATEKRTVPSTGAASMRAIMSRFRTAER